MKRKSIIILAVILVLVILCAWYFMRPLSVRDIAKKMPDDSQWKDKIKEVKVENLYHKMGRQIFCLDSDQGNVYFLMNRFQEMEPFNSTGKMGDFICMDYDDDGKYELLYLSHEMLRSYYVPQLYIYGTSGGKIHLEAVYGFHDENDFGPDHALTLDKKGNLYIVYNEAQPKYNVSIEYLDGQWTCKGENADSIKVEEETAEYRKRKHNTLSDY